MLKRINGIKNIRNFHNFSCSEEFTKKNVIYALNGSGKTNLSRFLDVFSQSDLHVDNFQRLKSLEAKRKNSSIDFELVFNESDIVSLANLQLPDKTKILVYNKEFLDQNVSIDDFSKKTHTGNIQVGLIGKNEAEIKRLSKDLQEMIDRGTKIKDECTIELAARAVKLQKSTKGRINTFTEYLKYDNFNKKYINSIKNKAELQIAAKNFEAINKIDEDDKINFLSPLNSVDCNAINEVLSISFKFEDIEKEVETHISRLTKTWIQTGLEFYNKEAKDQCPFCRQSTLNLDVIRKYIEYIESKKAKTIDIIDGFIKNLSFAKTTILENQKILDNGLTLKTTSYIELFKLDKKSFNHIVDNGITLSQIERISDLLVTKKGNLELLFTKTENEEIKSSLLSIQNDIESIQKNINANNSLIKQINLKITDTGARKSELRKQMAQWALIEYFLEKEAELETLRKDYAETKEKLDLEKDKSPQKEKKELITKLLKRTLLVAGLNKYTVDDDFHLILNVKDDSKFDISEQTQLVSDGEKSVIAFAYYFASILQEIEKFEDLDKLTLIIDDPISSTSYNYIHGIGVVLKKMNALFQEVLESKRNEVPQIIILTHNLQFYNLLATNIFKQDKNEQGKKNSFFYLHTKDGNPILEKETKNGKLSEYMTSLRRVYKFSTGNLDENIGNDLRKVIETICSFNSLILSHENLEKVFNQEIKSNLKLIADDYVHTDLNNYEDPLPFKALQDASEELLMLIESKYKAQYEQVINS